MNLKNQDDVASQSCVCFARQLYFESTTTWKKVEPPLLWKASCVFVRSRTHCAVFFFIYLFSVTHTWKRIFFLLNRNKLLQISVEEVERRKKKGKCQCFFLWVCKVQRRREIEWNERDNRRSSVRDRAY